MVYWKEKYNQNYVFLLFFLTKLSISIIYSVNILIFFIVVFNTFN